MRDGSNIVRVLKDRQQAMRREIDRRGMSLKALSFDSGIPYSTLLSYLPEEGAEKEPALMPVSAQYALCGVIPDDILSLLLPNDRQIVQIPTDIDHDRLAEHFQEYLIEKARAHHPDSPGGREIVASEDERLRTKLAVVRAA